MRRGALVAGRQSRWLVMGIVKGTPEVVAGGGRACKGCGGGGGGDDQFCLCGMRIILVELIRGGDLFAQGDE